METRHYREELSAFANGEVSPELMAAVRDHLDSCIACRTEYNEIAFGAQLASSLSCADAADHVWASITDSLEGRNDAKFGLLPASSGSCFRKGFAFVVALVAVTAIAGAVFVSLFSDESPYQAVQTGQNTSYTNQSLNADLPTNANVAVDTHSNADANTNIAVPVEGFDVETLAGSPMIEGGSAARIGVGQLLETDARSTARIEVADIGTVDVSPNSRIRLAETGRDEHRLSLERGKLHAKIYAPPRLFVVDTPSARAVDLGCEYTLEVDKNGDSVLHVTGGWVSLERDKRESIVPAGMMCKTRKGGGLGTPFNADATEAFRQALDSFDFARGGSTAVQAIIREAEFYDMFTLWHLLSRVSKADRGLVYDALAELVPPPDGVTREGIVALDRKMLEAWKVAVENAWFS